MKSFVVRTQYWQNLTFGNMPRTNLQHSFSSVARCFYSARCRRSGPRTTERDALGVKEARGSRRGDERRRSAASRRRECVAQSRFRTSRACGSPRSRLQCVAECRTCPSGCRCEDANEILEAQGTHISARHRCHALSFGLHELLCIIDFLELQQEIFDRSGNCRCQSASNSTFALVCLSE